MDTGVEAVIGAAVEIVVGMVSVVVMVSVVSRGTSSVTSSAT